MKLEGYKSGIYNRVEDYRAFILSKINYNWGWEDSKINKLLEEASFRLGELNSYSLLVPNIDIYIKMFNKFEAINSCKIDEREAKIEEILGENKELDENTLEVLKDIQNLEAGMNYGKDKVKNGESIDTRMLGEIHKILMEGTKKEESTIGRLRNSQNWIGGDTPKNATFVPPPYAEVAECLVDFEKFILNDDTDTPDLVKIAMLHYQFETIHPFVGGNRKNRKSDNSIISSKQRVT